MVANHDKRREDQEREHRGWRYWAVKILAALMAMAITVSSLGAPMDLGKRTNTARIRVSRSRRLDD